MRYEVSRREAESLIADLRSFAFARSPGFRDDILTGYEETKTFYLGDPVPRELENGKRFQIGQQTTRGIFGFSAFRAPRTRRQRDNEFTLSVSIERTLDHLPARYLDLIEPDTLAAYDNFSAPEEDLLTEAAAIIFDVTSATMRAIGTNVKHSLSYKGDTVHSNSTEDILHLQPGNMEPIPAAESAVGFPMRFVPDVIHHERLHGNDRLETTLGFWSLIDGIDANLRDSGVTWRSAATQMRTIMRTLETGIV